MDISINTRHCTIPESIRNQTQIRLQRVMRFNPQVHGATVNFSVEGTEKQVELRLPIKSASPLLSRGEGPTFRTALDRAMDRLERQLKSRNQRHRNRRPQADLRRETISA